MALVAYAIAAAIGLYLIMQFVPWNKVMLAMIAFVRKRH